MPPRIGSLRICRRGFTLIEIIIVLVVLAILVTALVPRFSQTARRLRVEKTAVELSGLLRYANARAVTQARNAAWVWNADSRRAQAGFLTVDGTLELFTERQAVTDTVDSTFQVTVTSDDRPIEQIDFYPDGTALDAQINLQGAGKAYTIRIDGPTSQVAIEEGVSAR